MPRLRLNRDQLAKFLPDHESIREFEALFNDVNASTEATDTLTGEGSSQSKANLALAEISKLKQATFETINENLKSYDKTLTYSGVKLLTVVYAFGSKTITKTLNYTGIKLTSVVLSGNTPSRIKLTKTFTYSGLNLTGVAYT